VGDPAPDFTMPTDGGGRLTLSSLKGNNVILYFYPKDDTSGCTKEACGFRDALPYFAKANAVVIGVSRDSVASHNKFKARHDLPFALVSDEDGMMCQAYGTWVKKSMYGRTYMGVERATFLVDKQGKLRGIWRRVKVPGHVEEVLTAAKAL
jgi:peroxiredoxin Q/BCP